MTVERNNDIYWCNLDMLTVTVVIGNGEARSDRANTWLHIYR